MRNNRIFEIDFLRVIAILLMIVFHLVYDLKEFAGVSIDYEAPFWHYVGKTSALLFIFVSGISSGFSRNSFKRGIKVFIFGMIITVVTYFFDKEQYIRFGILHFLGISMILYPILTKLKKGQLLMLSIICILIGIKFNSMEVSTYLLLPMGLTYGGFNSMDYYPLFPYLWAFIIGIIAYKGFYERGYSVFKKGYKSRIINFISKNSLKIYLIHQPIILAIIYIINLGKKY